MASNPHVTIRDVAESASVSTATVSRVLSGDGYVSLATRKRVEKSIQKLGYSPSFAAQSLRTKKSTVIGLVITDIQNPFYPELVSGVEEDARARGYSLILCNSQEDIQRESAYIDYLASHRTNGILICAPGMANRQRKRLKAFSGQVVLLNENQIDKDFTSIISDNFEGGRQIGSHLQDLNMKKIFYFGTEKEAQDGSPRYEGLKKGSRVNVEYMKDVGDWAHPSDLVREVLKRSKPPFAVVTHNDIRAIAAMHEFINLGLEVPGDVVVVGYDDIAMSELVNPSLTTVNQKLKTLAKMALDALESLITGDSRELNLVIKPELVIRNSSQKMNKKTIRKVKK